MNSKRAIVVGSGVAGLSAAVRLAAKGYKVEVFEAADGPGGKLKERLVKGYRFDLGPSLFTLPELITEIDRLPGAPPEMPPFEFEKLDRSTHYFWPDGKRLVAWADNERFVAEAVETLGADADALRNMLATSARNFEGTRGVFLDQPIHHALSRGPRNGWSPLLKALPRLPLSGTLHGFNARTLKGHPELVQLFDRYATYNGSDPYRAPAMMNVIPHLEHGVGTFFPRGGMFGIVKHLYLSATARHVQFHFNAAVERILHNGKRVTGIQLENGNQHHASVVVSNADIHPTYRQLLPDLPQPERILSQERSTSGLIFYWGVRGTFPELHLHNILFSEDYKREFERIANEGDPGDDPTVYINITSKLKADDAPAGCENWFVLINVAANPEKYNDPTEVERIKQAVIARVEQALGREPGSFESLIEFEDVLRPSDIESRTSSWRGALYGASSNSPMSAFLRHRNKSRDLDGLYFCGGSVHPGGGIPLCLLSGRIVSELVAP
jgi:phytoene desaturase